MWGKIIFLIFLLGVLLFSSWLLYQNIQGSPEQLKINNQTSESQKIIYGEVKQFYSNMRFNHNIISYSIDSSCSDDRIKRMEQAFSILHNYTKIISFYQSSENNLDLLIGCSENYIQQSENTFVAGEGGPTKIINTSLYSVILQGKISLYKESKCDRPIVEMHELLHVFGFDHSSNPDDIMYNTSSCQQQVSQNIINTLVSLYSQKILPDLYIENVNATKKGRYLDFNVEVRNQGLADVQNASLSIMTDSKIIDVFYLNEIEFGAGKSFYAKNLKLPLGNVDKIEFIIDRENSIEEINKNNNKVELTVAES